MRINSLRGAGEVCLRVCNIFQNSFQAKSDRIAKYQVHLSRGGESLYLFHPMSFITIKGKGAGISRSEIREYG